MRLACFLPSLATFPSCACRLNAAPPARQQDNYLFALPVPGRPGLAARVGADVLPKNSLGIFPNSDSQLHYPERSPTDRRHHDVACDRIDALLLQILLSAAK